MALQRPTPPADDDYPYYEETVTESTWHFRVINYLSCALDERYQDRDDVFVCGNHFIYWEEGDRDKKQAPDIFVCFGAVDADRKSYKVWEAGPPPQVVFEITSESSRITDQGNKRAVYEMLGVEEYYLFDPLAEYIPRRLRAFRREQDLLLPVASSPIYSPRLELEVRVADTQLRLFDPQAQRTLGSYREAEEARRQAEKQLAEERRRVEQLEARLRELEGR